MSPPLEPADPFAPAPRSFPQARARITYEALLDAAREVFAERGFDEAQTPELAARAAVSVGTFYRYFRDKRHIFVEMIGHHLAQTHAGVAAELEPSRFRGAEARHAIGVAVDVLTAHMRRHPRLHRVYLEMALREPEVQALRVRFEALGEAVIRGLIEEVIPRSVLADPAAAARVIVIAAIEVTLSRIGLRGAREARPDDAAVQAALVEMIHRFVFPAHR